jgi:hypothetical protein
MAEKMKSPKDLRWLPIFSWVFIALAYLAFFLADLRLDYEQLQIACQGEGCNYSAISQAEIDILESLGLSSRSYSLLMNGATVLAVALSWTLGGVILLSQSGARNSWFVSLALIVIPITLISDADNLAASYPNWFIPSVILSQIGSVIFLLFLYLFPSGRFFPRRAFIPFIITFLLFSLFSLANARLIDLPAWAVQFDFMILIGLLFLAGGLQVFRYRRNSNVIEKQQTKWVMLGLFLLILSFPTWFIFFWGVVEIPPGQARLAASLVGWFASLILICMLPVTIAIAILRYRLWDIDIVIRRTLQYSLITGLLGLVYFGGVALLQAALGELGGQPSPVVTVITTLATAALFNPLRRRVQDFIDRRFYRRKYDAEKALAEFALAARSETDLAQLTTRLVGTVQEALQPDQVSLWMQASTRKNNPGAP